MNDEWKVLTEVKQMYGPGIYQEKMLVICPREDEVEFNRLKNLVTEHGRELAPVPLRAQEIADANNTLVFAYWYNKQDRKTTEKDILEGNIRVKIN